ncbi:hypothetical protein [Burkholderia vietnamiensis]|uniref:hypothetical protein n=1 Tax=Burkholderia vietnamiensis TaxID=60552 RepID=UPI001CF4EAE6|nr:hypothetical protein [Burkholderia vietnamiensis]MCA8148159.1 hypothetical protein [Burkholderia vietnamiensis]
MTIRIDTLNNARATLAADGPWGSMAVGDALTHEHLSTETANNLRATQDTPVWGGAFVYDCMGPLGELQDACEEAGARLVQLAQVH